MTLILLVLVLMLLAWAAGSVVAQHRRERRSIDDYGRAMRHLGRMMIPPDDGAEARSSRASKAAAETSARQAKAAFDPRSDSAASALSHPAARVDWATEAAIDLEAELAPPVPTTVPPGGDGAPIDVLQPSAEHRSLAASGGDPLQGLRRLGAEIDGSQAPRVVEEAARVVGVSREPSDRAPGVEANARLTATTGLVLVVLFFFEGLTIPVVGQFLSWHVAIGLALIPPVILKLGSTLWRFGHYYLRDPRYRRAGPPHPLLRVLGPIVIVTTAAVIATGVALWLAGPHQALLFQLHRITFVLWFGVVAVHLLAHAWRATRLAAADSRSLRRRAERSGARTRRVVVAVSLALGLAVGLVSTTVTTGWSRSPLPPQGGRAVVQHSSGAGHQPEARPRPDGAALPLRLASNQAPPDRSGS